MRFRPHLSVRTLAIVVTLVCACFGTWEPTKNWAASDIEEAFIRDTGLGAQSVHAVAPLFLIADEGYYLHETDGIRLRHYYFWVPGCAAKLPFVSNLYPAPTKWPEKFPDEAAPDFRTFP